MIDPVTVERSVEPEPTELPIDIRPAADGDVPFIRSTWLEGHRQSPDMERMPFWMYKQKRRPIIDALLSRTDTHVIAAYVPSDDPKWPERIAGWLCWTPGRVPALHWLYVRDKHRRQGLAWELFEQSGIGGRLVYTFVGAQRPEKMKRVYTNEGKLVARKYSGTPYSELLAAAAFKRGVSSAFIDAQEFLSDA